METVSGFKLKTIFLDNNNWWRFFSKHCHVLRPAIISNVLKMLVCRTDLLGFHQFICPDCNYVIKVPHSCKGHFCSSCGKKATDLWIKKNMAVLPNTTWQHITFTMPSELWNFFWLNRNLFNLIAAIAANIIKKIAKKKKVILGIYVAIHTFGRDLKRNVHIHLSVTRGGLSFENTNKWIKDVFFSRKVVEPQWRYQIITLFRNAYKKGGFVLPLSLGHIKNYTAFNSFLNVLFNKTWVVHFGQKSNNKKRNVDYLGKYLKRPPLGETRIKNYDGKSVSFDYLDHYSNSKATKSLSVDDFIKRLVTHIHDANFRCIRYYGFLSNRTRGKLLPIVHKLLNNPFFNELYRKIKISWQQLITKTFGVDPLKCKNCGQTMELNLITFPQKLSLVSMHQSIACNQL